MHDLLDTLAQDAKRTVKSGYYNAEGIASISKHERCSLRKNILRCERNPIIAEIKTSSPSRAIIRRDIDAVYVATDMKKGGAVGISVLTEPKHFKGSLQDFKQVREDRSIPLLMKDFIISQIQIDMAYKMGADVILLIQALFDRNYCDSDLDEMIAYAQSHNLEVLLEAHTEDEFKRAVCSNAEFIGINNRDLKTLTVDLHVTEEILKKNGTHNRTIISESGIESPAHIRLLRNAGAKAFLVGTAVMTSDNIEEKVRQLVEA